jgi:hypothetical protein
MKIWIGAALIGMSVGLSGCGSDGAVANPDGFARTADPAQIKIFVTTGQCDTLDAPTTTETGQQVTVKFVVHVADENEPCDSIAPKVHAIDVKLKSPLGDRAVLSSERDTPLPERPATPAP